MMAALLGWWFMIEILGILALPITLILLRHLPEKGYAFSKVVALLMVGYFSWIFGYVSFGRGTVWLAVLTMILLSSWILWDQWVSIKEYLGRNLGFILVVESLFLMAFLIAGAYKMRTPDIVGTEKPMDFAMINGILASPSMPPQDPWLSGGSISYYYFGYMIVSALSLLSGVGSGVAYNLAIALTWSLAAVCTFSLAYGLTRRYRYSLFSVAALALFGNLDYWYRVIQSFQIGDLRIPYYNFPANPSAPKGLGAALDFLFSPLAHGWDYFQASRIIPVPPTDKMINEFPSFSFFLSDLHPHVMAIPFVLLAIAAAYSLLRTPFGGMQVLGARPVVRWIYWFLLMVLFGGLSFMNSWDFPTFMLLLGSCLFLQQGWALAKEDTFMDWLIQTATVGVPIVAGSFIIYLPFYLKFQSQAKGLGIVGDRTHLYYLFILFGLFFLILTPALIIKSIMKGNLEKNGKAKTKKTEEPVCSFCGRENPGKKYCGTCGGEMSLASDSEVMVLPKVQLQGIFDKLISYLNGSKGRFIPIVTLLTIGLVLGLLDLEALKLGTLFATLLLAGLAVLSIIQKTETRETIFSALLALLAFLLIIGCEIVFIKDHFSGGSLYRMNTVFKFHYQAWILLSLASGFWLKWIMENAWPQWTVLGKSVWGFTIGLALLGAALYPVLAFTARMNGSSVDNVTMDGAVYYERTFPADFQVAQWIKINVKPTVKQGNLSGVKVPIILECPGLSYHQDTDTVATLTGFPTVLGWDFHEAQWRGSWDQAVIRGQNSDDTIQRRQGDVETIYTSMDLAKTKDLLTKYNIDYIYVGDAERQKYSANTGAFSKFAQLGSLVYAVGNSMLYKLNP